MPEPIIVNRPANNLSVFLGDPCVEIHFDCVFVPADYRNFWENKEWGIYSAQGDLIDAAAYRSLPEMQIVGQNHKCLVDLSNAHYAPEQCYFYVGNIIKHYGHFICSSMVRLWALSKLGRPHKTFIGHCAGGPETFYSWPFARALLGSAGLNKNDFAHFTEPVRIKELIIPRPAFIEQNLAYSAFASAAHVWGDRLSSFSSEVPLQEIAYISKSRYRDHPDGLSNETEIVEQVEALGVPVYYPETLSVPDQIQLFRQTRVLVGQIGSAFHTSIFKEGGQKIVNIVPSPNVYGSNYALIDGINQNKATYLYFEGDFEPRVGANAGFRIKDPRTCARKLLEVALD